MFALANICYSLLYFILQKEQEWGTSWDRPLMGELHKLFMIHSATSFAKASCTETPEKKGIRHKAYKLKGSNK